MHNKILLVITMTIVVQLSSGCQDSLPKTCLDISNLRIRVTYCEKPTGECRDLTEEVIVQVYEDIKKDVQ